MFKKSSIFSIYLNIMQNVRLDDKGWHLQCMSRFTDRFTENRNCCMFAWGRQTWSIAQRRIVATAHDRVPYNFIIFDTFSMACSFLLCLPNSVVPLPFYSMPCCKRVIIVSDFWLLGDDLSWRACWIKLLMSL